MWTVRCRAKTLPLRAVETRTRGKQCWQSFRQSSSRPSLAALKLKQMCFLPAWLRQLGHCDPRKQGSLNSLTTPGLGGDPVMDANQNTFQQAVESGGFNLACKWRSLILAGLVKLAIPDPLANRSPTCRRPLDSSCPRVKLLWSSCAESELLFHRRVGVTDAGVWSRPDQNVF